jgi:hypothetical protein
MKKLLQFVALYFALVGAAHAQSAAAVGDVVIPGTNSWTLHTPDDGRSTLYFTPSGGGGAYWNYAVSTEFSNNGDVFFKGKVKMGSRISQAHPDYRLSVEGKLVTQSIYVTNPTTWADFVFEPSYKLMPLPALENYLLTNKHLPYIPSAKEVETNGYNVAEMDAKLLRTVEELTLQVIALSKQVEEMKAGKGLKQDTK